MIFIKIIISFLCGIVFVQWIFPLIDGILGLILTQLEVWKGYMAIKITKSQKQVEELTEKSNENHFQQIGFTILEEDKGEEPND